MKSIQRYLRTQILWRATVILAAGAIVLGLAIRRLDIREFDAALETKARTLATLVLHNGDSIEVDFAGEYMPEFETAVNTEYFQFRQRDGAVIERSERLNKGDLPFLPVSGEGPVFMNLRLPDGRQGRLVQIAFPLRQEGQHEAMLNGDHNSASAHAGSPPTFAVLSVARSREGLDHFLIRVYFTLAGMDLLLLALIALAVEKSLIRGFKPLVSMDAQIRQLGPRTLEQRIQMHATPVELQTILSALNSFIEQCQLAFIREQRFTSDVAHELRTPVAEFQAACDVGAKWSDDPALVQSRFNNLRESAANMSVIVDELLELSRLDMGAVALQPEQTQLSALIDTCWERVLENVVTLNAKLENRIDPTYCLTIDAVKLGMIVRNLLGNAAAYSTPGSKVICAFGIFSDGERTLCISNHAGNLDEQDLEHMFDRFWRKDSARTTGRHAGLGLSIVKALADVLGIRLRVDLTPENLFTVRLHFSS